MTPAAPAQQNPSTISREIRIPPVGLAGTLNLPTKPVALVIFAHGSGSSHFSPRNMRVAQGLNEHRIATLLLDLLTTTEEEDRANVFDIPLLAERLSDAVHWTGGQSDLAQLPIGFFGASTGAAAALVAAANLGNRIYAVVSRGGRPDLAGAALKKVVTPTLFIVGGTDYEVIGLNDEALQQVHAPKALEIVPGASHLFPEPGALDEVVRLAADWFTRHVSTTRAGTSAERD